MYYNLYSVSFTNKEFKEKVFHFEFDTLFYCKRVILLQVLHSEGYFTNNPQINKMSH